LRRKGSGGVTGSREIGSGSACFRGKIHMRFIPTQEFDEGTLSRDELSFAAGNLDPEKGKNSYVPGRSKRKRRLVKPNEGEMNRGFRRLRLLKLENIIILVRQLEGGTSPGAKRM